MLQDQVVNAVCGGGGGEMVGGNAVYYDGHKKQEYNVWAEPTVSEC